MRTLAKLNLQSYTLPCKYCTQTQQIVRNCVTDLCGSVWTVSVKIQIVRYKLIEALWSFNKIMVHLTNSMLICKANPK